jgi:integrase
MHEAQTPYKLALNRSGLWEVRWSERGDKRWLVRTWSTGERERAPADAKAQEFWSARHLITTHQGATRVQECVDGYLRAAERGKGVGPTQRWSLGPIVALLGHKAVIGMGSDDIEDYREQRRRRGIKTGTIRRELGALVAALNWAASEKSLGVSRNDLPRVELGAPSAPRVVYLDRGQERDFWARALADTTGAGELSRVARYVCLALGAAQRSEANLDLTWDRVDFARGLIDFRVPGMTATNKRRGVVPIADRLRPVLERARRESIARSEPASTLVCGPGSIRKAWETWLATTPYRHIHPHDLRRTWASLAVQAGVPIYEVASVLNDDVATVERHYGVLRPGHLKAAINAV